MHLGDVILASAAPPGRGPRAIARLSGPRAVDVARSRVHAASWERGVRAGRFDLPAARGTLGVPVLVACFPGPRSYTGEDIVEIQMPGHAALVERAIDALQVGGAAAGLPARRAEPGEFTARAFFAGRLDLTEAEGVAATIAAESDAQLRAARLLTDGTLARRAREAADKLAATLALVEAGIDFTDEEDVVAIAPAPLLAALEDVARRVDAQLRHAVGVEQIEAIPWVVLAGPPNAGKSTLFNALLGRTRAVVAAIAGTTRDALAEPLALPTVGGRLEIMLVDVAGHDDGDRTTMGRHMRQAADDARQRAALILECRPPATPLPAADDRVLPVRTKGDLAPARHDDAPIVRVSAERGEGLDALRAAIAARLAARSICLAASTVVLQPRHEAALREARARLAEAIELVAPRREERALADAELVAAALRAALDALGTVAGAVTPDDVLGHIFAQFCVGK